MGLSLTCLMHINIHSLFNSSLMYVRNCPDLFCPYSSTATITMHIIRIRMSYYRLIVDITPIIYTYIIYFMILSTPYAYIRLQTLKSYEQVNYSVIARLAQNNINGGRKGTLYVPLVT